MRYFLDMNLPIYFCLQIGNNLEEKAKNFVENKKDHIFLLCDYIASINLPKWLKRQKVILFEFNQKIQNKDYVLFSSEQSEVLFPQDKILTNRLVLNYNDAENKKKFVENTNQIFNLLQARVSYFIKKYIDKIVILHSEINFELKSCLFTWLTPNDSDARTIASAVQEHNNERLTIITSDKQHWTKELLEEVHNDSRLLKKYPLLPKIEYLQDYCP
jgi:hypothetical protein